MTANTIFIHVDTKILCPILIINKNIKNKKINRLVLESRYMKIIHKHKLYYLNLK